VTSRRIVRAACALSVATTACSLLTQGLDLTSPPGADASSDAEAGADDARVGEAASDAATTRDVEPCPFDGWLCEDFDDDAALGAKWNRRLSPGRAEFTRTTTSSVSAPLALSVVLPEAGPGDLQGVLRHDFDGSPGAIECSMWMRLEHYEGQSLAAARMVLRNDASTGNVVTDLNVVIEDDTLKVEVPTFLVDASDYVAIRLDLVQPIPKQQWFRVAWIITFGSPSRLLVHYEPLGGTPVVTDAGDTLIAVPVNTEFYVGVIGNTTARWQVLFDSVRCGPR
jgi:hypothetical protein